MKLLGIRNIKNTNTVYETLITSAFEKIIWHTWVCAWGDSDFILSAMVAAAMLEVYNVAAV